MRIPLSPVDAMVLIKTIFGCFRLLVGHETFQFLPDRETSYSNIRLPERDFDAREPTPQGELWEGLPGLPGLPLRPRTSYLSTYEATPLSFTSRRISTPRETGKGPLLSVRR